MHLRGLFKRRGCAAVAAVALFLCLAANAGAQDIDSILWDIQTAIWRDEGDTVVRLIRQNNIDINAPYFIHLVGWTGSAPDRDKLEGYATALSSAVFQGCPNVVKALLDAGADVNAHDRFGGTALGCATRSGVAIRNLNILIDYGADLNAQDDNGDTALMEYARWGAADYAKILLDAGADVNIRNNEGLTALMIAEREGEILTAQLLRRARGYR